jgi:TANFOR domain-containing protein
MRSLHIRFLIASIAFALFGTVSHAQNYPVQANVQLLPPYTPYLGDYVIAGSEKISIQLLLKDVSVNNYQVKLRLKIEGVGITIQTENHFSGPPISLQGGSPILLSAFELAPYFNTRNLQFSGLSKSDFQRTGKLPEGLYKFTIEVFDYHRNKQVANPASAMAWIVLNDPPLMNLPVNNFKVTNLMPQFIAFQWTPRHMGSPNSAFSTEYIFKLVEIWPIERNANDAILSQRPLYETITNQTQLIYGPTEPLLIPGRNYAWQITARDTEKRDLFKNQGRSEVFMFRFGDACNAPKNLKIASQGASFLRASWNADPVHERYNIRFREEGQHEWYGQSTISTQATLSSLNPGTTYEYKIQADCGQISSDYSAVFTEKTLLENKNQFVCGAPSVPQKINPGEPLLQILGMNDVIDYHNYKITVKEITASANGAYSGNAIAVIPYLNSAQVKMTFKNVRVTQSYKVISGEMETVWNPDSEWTYTDEPSTEEDDGNNNNEKPKDHADTISTIVPEVVTIAYEGVIDSVYVGDDGKIVVVDEKGTQTSYQQNKNEETGEPEETTVTDKGGNTYVVSKDGTISGGKLPDPAANSNGGAVTVSSEIEEELTLAVVDFYIDELTAYLKANPEYEKGPNASDAYVPDLEDLPNCLQTRQSDLSYIKRYLNYLKRDGEARSDFIGKLKAQSAEFMKQLVEAQEQKKKPENRNKPIRDLIPVVTWRILTDAICEYVVVPAQEYHVSKGLEQLMPSHLSECFIRGFKKGMTITTSFDLALFTAWIETGLCLTEKEKCGGSYEEQFTCGVANALIQEIDVASMAQGAAQMLTTFVRNQFNCVIEGGTVAVVMTAENTSEQIRGLSKCVLGIDMNREEWTKLYDAINKYAHDHTDDAYTHGQACVFVATIAIPIFNFTKAKVIAKLNRFSKFAAEAEELKKIVKVADEGGDVGRVLEEMNSVTDNLISSLNGSIKATYDDLIKAGLKPEVKANSILLKNTTGETVAIIYKGKLTPTKWAWQKDFSEARKKLTSEGYITIIDGNELKFDLGFKDGRKLEAKEVNDYLVKGQGKDLDGQPYWAGTQVEELVLGRKGEIIYFIENYNDGIPNPGQFASKDPITTLKELREKLAVKEAWKKTGKEPTLRAYRVKSELNARSGTIGRQSDNGIELPGGGHQYEIVDYLGDNWKNYLEEVGPIRGTKLQ